MLAVNETFKKYIVDDEGSIVSYNNKLYRISGVELRRSLITNEVNAEYKLVPVSHVSNMVEPLWVQAKSVKFLRS